MTITWPPIYIIHKTLTHTGHVFRLFLDTYPIFYFLSVIFSSIVGQSSWFSSLWLSGMQVLMKWLSKSEGWLNFCGNVALLERKLCSRHPKYSLSHRVRLDTSTLSMYSKKHPPKSYPNYHKMPSYITFH